MDSPAAWFVILLSLVIAGPYVFGVQPRERKEWTLVAITIAFLAWLLLSMVPLRSR